MCTVSPGFAGDPPNLVSDGLLWAKRRDPSQHRPLTGVHWSSEINITKAAVTRCAKCGETKPEVCPVSNREPEADAQSAACAFIP